MPPWVGCEDEEDLKQKILALSNDERNVTRDPPPGALFDFDFDRAFPVAQATLLEDARLDQLRFKLVPKKSAKTWRGKQREGRTHRQNRERGAADRTAHLC